MTKPGLSLAERFWLKVSQTDDCWEWTASVDGGGYGQLFSGKGQNLPMIKAHRFSWELAYGPVPADMDVCHKCDKPRCVRPSHLFLGTARDNARDAAEKGRIQHRLTPQIARAIYDAPGRHREIAKQFGVAKTLVTRIKAKQIWKHIHV